jgi:dimeric dUTPase (all-alpha-NTP-PPase superfamily)
MDKLEEIFKLQAELNDTVFKTQNIRDSDGQVLTMDKLKAALQKGDLGPNGLTNQWLRNYLKALTSEAEELDQELLWKWWSKDKLDMQNIRVEIVDLLHFLISLALTAGMAPEDFHRLYVQKGEINRKRQAEGYSKSNKNEQDNRSIT